MTNNTETATAPAFTAEQLTLAAQLNERVRTNETQGNLAVFAQARDLREIRDQELYKAIENKDGDFYQNFGDYIKGVSTKSPGTISQNISVVTTFSQYPDERLAEAGAEKLDIARKMIGEGFYKDTDTALKAAIANSRGDLISIRKSAGGDSILLAPLSPRKVVKALATRFEEGFAKYAAVYAQVHNTPDSTPTDSQVTEFYLDVVNGLPEDFLLEAAAGQGGAAPVMEGGFTPQDVPIPDVVMFLAEKLVEAGRDPFEVIDLLKEGVQGVQDRAEVVKREQDEQRKQAEKDEKAKAKDAEKLAKAADRELNKKAKVLAGATKGYILVLADGAQAEVIDHSAPVDGVVSEIRLKGIRDGSDTVFTEEEADYNIMELARKGIVGINKPAKVAEEKKEAAPKEEAPTIGLSKAQQAGSSKKPKATKAPAKNIKL